MPQPVKHPVDVMLDAVRALVLEGGPAAASARAVCQATGASSGSVYHRFPRRDDLVAAAWLRAQDRFLRAYLAALTAPRGVTKDGPRKAAPEETGIEAAVTVLTWCRDSPDDARLLLRHALRDLLRGDISPALADRARTNQQALREALDDLTVTTGLQTRDVVLAVVDLPYAVARRALQGNGIPGEEDIDALRRGVTRLLRN